MATAPRDRGSQMDISKVRELVKLVEDSGIEELEVIHKDTTIRIQKSPTFSAPAAAMAPAPIQVPAAAAPPATATAAPADARPAAERDPARAKWREVRSPIVGTLYRAASPESGPFVTVGDHVATGQTLCIVEAMKVMNEIEAEFAGTVKEVLAEDAAPIEAEAILFLIDPD